MHNNLVFIFLCKTSCGFGDSGWIISVDFVVVSIAWLPHCQENQKKQKNLQKSGENGSFRKKS